MVKGKTEQSCCEENLFMITIVHLRHESVVASPDPLLSYALLGTSKG
jgi:hypothetical protein